MATNDKFLPIRANGEKVIGASPARVLEVLYSPLFQRLAVGFQYEGPDLWIHLRDLANLVGDPATWMITVSGRDSRSQMSDGLHTWPIPQRFTRVALASRLENVWSLRIKKIFEFNYSMRVGTFAVDPPEIGTRIHYTIRKSASFGSAPDTAFIWRVDGGEGTDARVGLMVRADGPVPDTTQGLLYLLHEICLTRDMTPIREERERKRKEAEIKRKQEEERHAAIERETAARQRELEKLEAAKVLAQERADQSRRDRERVSRLLDEDLCLKCERPVVMRRNKSNGQLFFGCSNFVTHGCRGVRKITCPKCHSPMIEKESRSGNEFLGCPRWPKCHGSRDIDSHVSTEAWLGRYDDYSADDFASDMGYDTWAQFKRDNNWD